MHGNNERFAYERNFSLAELIQRVDPDRLRRALMGVLEAPFRCIDEVGQVVIDGALGSDGVRNRMPLRLEFDTLGQLESTALPGRLQAATEMFELVLQSAARHLIFTAVPEPAPTAVRTVPAHQHASQENSERLNGCLVAAFEERVCKQAELIEHQRQRLGESASLVSIGRLAADVAHDLNVPVATLRSHLVTARGYLDKFAEVGFGMPSAHSLEALMATWHRLDLDSVVEQFRELLLESEDCAAHIAEMVEAFDGFAGIHGNECDADINVILRQALRLAAMQARNKAVVLVEEFSPLPPLRCHAGKLKEAFYILFADAFATITWQGEVRIRTRYADGIVEVEIRDTCQIGPESVNGRDSGLAAATGEGRCGIDANLAAARGIVEAHGGTLTQVANSGQGVSCTLRFPLNASRTR